MELTALIIGAILVAAALRNTQDVLFSALAEDVPAFMVWAAALFALGALGWIPGMKPVSRGLLALVIIVLIMNNHAAIIAGFSQTISNVGVGSNGASGGDTTATVPYGGSGPREPADAPYRVPDIMDHLPPLRIPGIG